MVYCGRGKASKYNEIIYVTNLSLPTPCGYCLQLQMKQTKLITGHVVLFAAAGILQWSDLTFHSAPGWRVRITRVVIQKLLSATRSVRRFQTDQLHVTNWIHNFISDKVRFHRVFCPVIKPLPRGRVGVERLILIAKTTWQVPREIHPELFELPCTQREILYLQWTK